MESFFYTTVHNLTFIGMMVLAGYILVKLGDDYQVRSRHKKIVAWSYDNQRVRWTGGADSFEEWLKTLPDIALESPTHLAREAAIGANVRIIGSLSDDSIARLGLRLQESWKYRINAERERRSVARNS